MEGWVRVDVKKIEPSITGLAYQLIEIAPIIDDLLTERKK